MALLRAKLSHNSLGIQYIASLGNSWSVYSDSFCLGQLVKDSFQSIKGSCKARPLKGRCPIDQPRDITFCIEPQAISKL